MLFKRILPAPDLRPFVESYWIVQDEDTTPVQQKIIPDGFPEVIFHFGDTYRINISGEWTAQSRSLLAGQIKKHFFLENTGRSDMIGIKFQPAAISRLFHASMDAFTDRVADLEEALGEVAVPWKVIAFSAEASEKKVEALEHFIREAVKQVKTETPLVDGSLSEIFSSHGMCSVSDLAQKAGVSERYLEQQFKKQVGLSPKFYARIIRFSRIFQLVQEENPVWSDLVYGAGFYDQSHFIRNFKSFTGEDPSRYGFTKKDLANFFMKK